MKYDSLAGMPRAMLPRSVNTGVASSGWALCPHKGAINQTEAKNAKKWKETRGLQWRSIREGTSPIKEQIMAKKGYINEQWCSVRGVGRGTLKKRDNYENSDVVIGKDT